MRPFFYPSLSQFTSWFSNEYLSINRETPMAKAIGGAIGVAKTLLDRIHQYLIAGAKPNREAFA